MDFNRQWTPFALDAEVEHFGTSRIAAAHNDLRAEVERLRADADRYRWLRSRVTYYNVDADWPVEAPNVPTLAQVSERIWYHATDDIVHDTLDAVIDAARKEGEG